MNFPPSCPALCRASTSLGCLEKTWMAGTSPAMTKSGIMLKLAKPQVGGLGDEIDECAHLGRQQPRRRIDQVDRQRRLLGFRRHDSKPTGRERERPPGK